MLEATAIEPLEAGQTQSLDDELDWLCLLSSTSPGTTQVDVCLSAPTQPQQAAAKAAAAIGSTDPALPAPAAHALVWSAEQPLPCVPPTAAAVLPSKALGEPLPAVAASVYHVSHRHLASVSSGSSESLDPMHGLQQQLTQQEQLLLLAPWEQHPLQMQQPVLEHHSWQQQVRPALLVPPLSAAAGGIASKQVPHPAVDAGAAAQLDRQQAPDQDLATTTGSRRLQKPGSQAVLTSATPYTHQQQQQRKQQMQQGHAAGSFSGRRGRGRPPRQPGQPVATMTGAQRYHYRRKDDLARMEQEVAEKLSQLKLLEQENQQLRWRAHVLESMVSNMDQHLECMAAQDTASPDQWLNLLLIGRSSSQQLAQPPLAELLERGRAMDVSQLTLQECVQRWSTYVAECRRLLKLVDAARAPGQDVGEGDPQQVQEQPEQPMPAAAPSAGGGELTWAHPAAGGCHSGELQPAASGQTPAAQQQLEEGSTADASRKPRRAAAVAAVSRISQFTQRQPLDAAPPLDAAGASSRGGVTPATTRVARTPAGRGLADAAAVMAAAAEDPPRGLKPLGMVNDQVLYGGPGSEGIPLDLLAALEQLVLTNIAWLLALATSDNIVRFQFFAADYEGKGRLPPLDSDLTWDAVLAATQLTPLQVHQCALCLQLAGQLRDRVLQERTQLQKVLGQAPAVICPPHGSSGGSDAAAADGCPVAAGVSVAKELDRMDGQMAAAATMEKNFKREELIKHMPGYFCANLLSLVQQARYAVACWPWGASPWALFGAASRHLEAAAKLTAEAAQKKPASSRRKEG